MCEEREIGRRERQRDGGEDENWLGMEAKK